MARVLLSEWRTFPSIYLGVIISIWRSHVRDTPPRKAKGSHAQRTPLNMGALRRVAAGLAHYYRARTRGDIKERSHPHRLRTRTRGFASTVELQQDTRIFRF